MSTKRMTGLAVFCALVGWGAATTALAADMSVLPGYWRSVNTSNFVVTKVTEDKRCLTAVQVNTFMTNPSNRHYKCEYTTRDVTDGKIRLHGTCVDKKGLTVQIDASGEYSPEWFKLSAKWSLHGLPVGGTASTEARRISAVCPAPETKTSAADGDGNTASR
jgi:hypothetical protein